MPLMPALEWATVLAASKAFFSASGEAMSGLLAPLRTATPIPELARSTRLPATTVPRLIRSSIASAVRMTRSATAPASSSFTSPLAEPQVTVSFVALVRSNAGTSSSITVFKPLVQRTFMAAVLSLGLDQHAAVLDHGLVGLDRHHAGRRHNLAGLDVELPVVEVALDHVALDEAFREQAGTVGAGVVGDVEFTIQVEHCQRKARGLDLQRAARRDVGDAAKVDPGRGGHARAPR